MKRFSAKFNWPVRIYNSTLMSTNNSTVNWVRLGGRSWGRQRSAMELRPPLNSELITSLLSYTGKFPCQIVVLNSVTGIVFIKLGANLKVRFHIRFERIILGPYLMSKVETKMPFWFVQKAQNVVNIFVNFITFLELIKAKAKTFLNFFSKIRKRKWSLISTPRENCWLLLYTNRFHNPPLTLADRIIFCYRCDKMSSPASSDATTWYFISFDAIHPLPLLHGSIRYAESRFPPARLVRWSLSKTPGMSSNPRQSRWSISETSAATPAPHVCWSLLETHAFPRAGWSAGHYERPRHFNPSDWSAGLSEIPGLVCTEAFIASLHVLQSG